MQKLLKGAAKRALRAANATTSRFGLFVLPNHYYTPISDIADLKRRPETWARPVEMTGVRMDAEEQLAWLRTNVAPYEPEFRGKDPYVTAAQNGFGPGYGFIESQCLYGVIRSQQPPRVIEVGSGLSTAIMLGAIDHNQGPTELICVEPYPRPNLRTLPVTIHEQRVEAMDLAFFDQLDIGDLLFIDSSHAVRPGGDVLHLYLSVLPRLKPGVIVHIHDIYLPYLYQRDLMTSAFQWTETALLLALLTNNPRLEVLACLSWLHYEAPDRLGEIFPDYVHQTAADGLADPAKPGHFPSSIWLRTA